MKQALMALVAVVGFAFLIGSNEAGDDKPAFNIKQVMAKMKGGAYKKLGEAEQVKLFSALAANTPPVGAAADWKARCDALVAAAKSGDAKKLDDAANCASCHKAHKKG